MFEEKVKEKEIFTRIYQDPEERKRLGIAGTQTAMAKYAGISPNLANKLAQRLRKNLTKTDGFDLRRAFIDEQEKIWNAFMDAVTEKRISPQVFKIFAQLAGQLVEKREENLKVEFTASNRISIARDLVEGLKNELRDTGVCVICGQRQAFHADPCLHQGREQHEEDEMAALALPHGPA